MFKNVLIESLDYFGRGVGHVDDKVVFVDGALPQEIVDIEVVNDKKKYLEARAVNYVNRSSKRIKSCCPFFDSCGGCNLLFYNYKDSLDFKLNKVKELLVKNKVNYNKKLEIVENKSPFNYRNKLSLKIVDGKIGFYEDSSHDLVEINECKVAKHAINEVIKNYKLLNIDNGTLTIRCNYNDEILLVIESDSDSYNIDLAKLKEVVKLVGIVFNNKTIYGDNFFYERISGFLFKVSYNSFFQVNPYITEVLFDLVSSNIDENSKVLDLYCGVGTLSLVASKRAKEVLGIEVVKNAVINAVKNAKLNKKDNVKFMLGDVKKSISKIGNYFDTLIIDPPRKGLDKETIDYIIKNDFKKIIYISCDVATLIRDLKSLEDYYFIDDYKILDMFSYSYHLESFVILELKA